MAPPRKRYPEPMMTRQQKRDRMDEICRRFDDGSAPADIAKVVGVTANHVRDVLREHGYDTSSDASRVRTTNAMWGLDDDHRRREIIRRAAEGARQRLAELRGANL